MSNTFTMPLGPVHVALEEPVYFHLTVEGETVRHVELTSGHVHRGMEAMATQRNLIKNVTLTERVCSLCSNSHSFTYSMAVENVLGITIPERACYLRVLAEEIKRIASHLFNTAIQAHIIGFKSLFMHVMEVREMMQDLKETVYGNRMNLAANCIGGVKYNVTPDLLDYMLLLTGMIKICRHSSQGKECVLHLVRPGRLLDAGVLFYEEGLPVTALGVQAGTVLRLDRKALLEALQHEAALGLALLTAMSLRQRLFINKIAGSQGRISVSGRVAAWLLHRAKMEKSATLDMGVTQETLARQMGISRESLSRELSALASAGLIDRNRRRITLLDADALRGRAEG